MPDEIIEPDEIRPTPQWQADKVTAEEYEAGWRVIGRGKKNIYRRRGRCLAVKADGERCRQVAEPRSEYCRYHGGNKKFATGLANPAYTTGSYSKYLPVKLRERYENILTDQGLLALDRSIALTDLRVTELLESLDAGGDMGRLWENLELVMVNLKESVRRQDDAGFQTHMESLGNIVQKGKSYREAWEDIGLWMERGRKLRESEMNRIRMAANTLTTEEAMALVAAVIDAVKANVTDIDTLQAISDQLSTILTSARRRGGIPANGRGVPGLAD